MLYLHIPTKHPPSFPDLDLASTVQSSALVAVGLLYQGTAHRLTTEILLVGPWALLPSSPSLPC